jgi:hypothetical protein
VERLHAEHDFDVEMLDVIRSCVEEFARHDVGVLFAAVWLEAHVSSRHLISHSHAFQITRSFPTNSHSSGKPHAVVDMQV